MTPPLPALRPGEFADTEEPDLFDTVNEEAMAASDAHERPASGGAPTRRHLLSLREMETDRII